MSSTKAKPGKHILQSLIRYLATSKLVVMIGLLVVVFSVLNPRFLTLGNVLNIIDQNAALAIVAVGITFAVISTNIDLSPGSAVALSGVVLALVYVATGNGALAITAGMLAAIGIGAFNGLVIAKLGVNSIIVTLAAMTWARGLGLALTDQASVIVDAGFVSVLNQRFAGLFSIPMITVVCAYLIGDVLLMRSRIGRYTFAIGGDETAAQESGIRVSRYKFLIFVLSGFYVGLATVLTVGRQGAATPNAVFGLELDAIVAVIVGGSKLTGGEGSVRRTLIGVLFLSILNNGLSTLGMRDAHFFLFKGGVILIALALDAISIRANEEVEGPSGEAIHRS